VWRQTIKVANKKPIEEFLKPQGRFKHLFAVGNEELLASVQAEVDRYLEYIQKRCECG
jgi:pyruvate ferredoxin oxidoreductase beta subunit